MFAGIVEATGRIEALSALGNGLRLRVDAGALGLEDVAVGDSIAINGACMTVTGREGDRFTVDVSAESLACTAGLDRVGHVNLEKSLRLGDRIDGHLVTGHVDGTGRVRSMSPLAESWELAVEVPAPLAAQVARKGSLAVHGVSLTVNRVDDERSPDGAIVHAVAWMNLIPHTVAVTTLGALRAGDRVNLEVDLIARYVGRALELAAAAPARPGPAATA